MYVIREILKRYSKDELLDILCGVRCDGPKVVDMTPYRVYQAIKQQKIDYGHENFYVVLLNSINEIVDILHIYKGNISLLNICIAEVFRKILTYPKPIDSYILAHNHPSNVVEPSQDDLDITQQFKEASILLSLKLMDHIIFTSQTYLSLASQKLM